MQDHSSPAMDHTCVPCIESTILNHWMSREVLNQLLSLRNLEVKKRTDQGDQDPNIRQCETVDSRADFLGCLDLTDWGTISIKK